MKAERRKKVAPTSLSAFLSVELSSDFSFQNLQIRTAPAKSSIRLSKPNASKATLLDSKAAHSATIASKMFHNSPIQTRSNALLRRDCDFKINVHHLTEDYHI
jgi:hypothetical protein